MEELKIDPEFKALIPPLATEERQQLEDNLKADGCRDPLVRWNGILLDGHNRKEICDRNGIGFRVQDIDLADRDAALLWIIANQNGRRNLADIDKIALAVKREEVLRRKAREREKSGKGADGSGGRGKKKTLGQNCPRVSDAPIHTRREAAKQAGVGERTYDAGKLILEAAEEGEVEPDVIDDLRNRKVAIHRVAKQIKEKRAKSKRKSKRQAAAKSMPATDSRIIIGDFRENADKVADNSVSLIFTDPPYDRKASKMLPDLGEFAAKKLAEGGSLILYVGQTQIPAALDALRPHLRYWWTVACVHAGRSTVMREYGVNAGWKAVLWFVKGTRHDNSVMVKDVMSGGEEKSHHDWQQSQLEAEYWIGKLCQDADDLVCDPFLGGGTTAAAANKLGKTWVGFEISEETAAVANQRIAG